jgi:reverse gyrase
MAEEQQELTAEAIKQRKKREKEAARNAALGIEKFTVEVAGVFKPDLKKVMAAHGINNQQDIHQRLLKNLIGADFETQAWMLRNVTTPYEPSEKVSRAFQEQSLAELKRDAGDEIIVPFKVNSEIL